jgi:hypothetical protein
MERTICNAATSTSRSVFRTSMAGKSGYFPFAKVSKNIQNYGAE